MTNSLGWLWIVLNLFVDLAGGLSALVCGLFNFGHCCIRRKVCNAYRPTRAAPRPRPILCTSYVHQTSQVRKFDIMDIQRDIFVYSDETYPYYFFTTVF